MKKMSFWPWLALAGGCGAFLLRWLQMRFGFEADTGLAITGSLWGILPPLFLAALAVLALALSRGAPGGAAADASLGRAFPVGGRAILPVLAAVLWLASGALELMGARTAEITAGYGSSFAVSLARGALLCGGLTVLAAVCVLCVLCPSPRDGRRAEPNAVLLLAAAALLVVELVLRYRELSLNPSLQAYYLPLLALTALCLGFYFAAAFAYGAGRSRRFLVTAVLGAALCLGAAADSAALGTRLFYLGGELWLLELLRLHAFSLSRRSAGEE